ncbi:MAG: SpoIID/LytB domain-containing protein [Actinomycetota bacterium]
MRLRPLALLVVLVAAASIAGGARAGSVCDTSCFQAPAGSGALLVFTGHGWGHGVGMSQYGAEGYAVHGSTYAQILDHYYPGTTLGKAGTSTIRVLMLDKQKTVTVTGTAPMTVVDGSGARHTLPAGPYTVKAAAQDWPVPLTFSPTGHTYLSLKNPYRGKLLVDLVDGKLRVIDIVGLEQYLWGVVPSEMPPTWAPEALKAQAVAARSYALATRAVGAPFDVYNDTRSQMYLGVAHESPATTAAVNATKGQVALYAGKVATTFFSSTSGGETESALDWTGTAIPYLVSVVDPYDALSPYHNWGPVPVTATTLLKDLKLTGPIMDVTTTPNQAGRVSQMKVTTPLTALAVAGTQVRDALGLRSNWFSVGLLALTPPQPVAPVVYGTKIVLSSVVRGLQGVTLEQRPFGGSWQTVQTVVTGSVQLPATPVMTTDYRLATATVASGSIRIKVMPAVAITAATAAGVAGTINPAVPNVQIDVQQENPDLTWTSLGTTTTAADGTFTLAGTFTDGATLRVVATPPDASYAPGTSASQIVSG